MTDLKRVIVDVDAGTDDYCALLILLQGEKIGKVKIEAIVCVNGNTTLDNVCKNVVRLLELTGRTDIPVYKGANDWLIGPREPLPPGFHGSDGFGDLEHDKEPDTSIIKNTPATFAIYDLVLKNRKEISLICIGPLTNLAITLKVYKDFISNVKDVWIMGGNHLGVGNVTSSAEFNFYCDPEAAQIVLSRVTCPIFILTWEACLDTVITLDWRFDVLGQIPSKPAFKLLTKAEKKIYDNSKHKDRNKWLACDPRLAAAFLDEKIIEKIFSAYADVELCGSETRGQVVIGRSQEQKPNVTIIEKINDDDFKNLCSKLVDI